MCLTGWTKVMFFALAEAFFHIIVAVSQGNSLLRSALCFPVQEVCVYIGLDLKPLVRLYCTLPRHTSSLIDLTANHALEECKFWDQTTANSPLKYVPIITLNSDY